MFPNIGIKIQLLQPIFNKVIVLFHNLTCRSLNILLFELKYLFNFAPVSQFKDKNETCY